MSKLLFVCAFSAIVSLSLGLSCTSPTVESDVSFTTQDATIVSQIAFITEFTLKCSNKASETSPLFAEIDGKLQPVSRIGTDRFQVSWTEETKRAHRGEYIVRLFDEEGFAAVRKAQRSGADVDSIAPLAEVPVKHAGAFNGPFVNSEILAAGLSILVAYFAFSTKNKLLS
ncbi:translocon-associated protein subunit delta [Contarinia nasturtii]|uniref:translocon-associated protein subunit delta n=1 Tax=Contarinia nasturtii TaxID=265458 RepID=UPI0012D39234|nr:translocon-associated protein subunit delta [Contarinia nasturtii]